MSSKSSQFHARLNQHNLSSLSLNTLNRCSLEQKLLYDAKHGIPFAIYAISTGNEVTIILTILDQYKEFQDVFEKKIVEIYLLEYRSSDFAINLQEGVQPLFGQIYNLAQNELIILKEYMEEIFPKNSFDIPSLQFEFQYSLSRRKMVLYKCALITMH